MADQKDHSTKTDYASELMIEALAAIKNLGSKWQQRRRKAHLIRIDRRSALICLAKNDKGSSMLIGK
jgi:hypothetical protein